MVDIESPRIDYGAIECGSVVGVVHGSHVYGSTIDWEWGPSESRCEERQEESKKSLGYNEK